MATMTVQPHQFFPPRDHRLSWSSNTAGAPLPLIPRRPQTATRSNSAPGAPRPHVQLLALQALATRNDYSSVIEDTDSGSSTSSDGSPPTIQTKTTRVARTLLESPLAVSLPPLPAKSENAAAALPQSKAEKTDENTPPSPRVLLYTPGSLRLSLSSTRARLQPTVSDQAETSATGAKSAPLPAKAVPPTPIRKKSGQVVKPSLKMPKYPTPGSLTIVTVPGTSKSEPATPTASKAVHFDAKLEHVKLFLAEQKPTAVSRDGSPTDDTSGTESDFPSFIYGDGNSSRVGKLAMSVSNMPSSINQEADVAVEEMSLSSDGSSVVGKVRVRNIAFHKSVVIRFTFDFWQTTSEVTGKYLESIDSKFDRFAFTIKLSDVARLEEKTILLAVRYNVDGRELWDNNNFQNYHATFSRVKTVVRSRPSKVNDEDASSASDANDLHDRLEKAIESKERNASNILVQKRKDDSPPPAFRTKMSLSARYDFGTSLKSPWKPTDSATHHTKSSSYPASLSPPSSIPWPQKDASKLVDIKINPILGSPRDIDPDSFLLKPRIVDAEDTPFSILPADQALRNHHRGYFDLKVVGGDSALKWTPPGTPGSLSPAARFHSFPPIEGSRTPPISISRENLQSTQLSEPSADSISSTPSLVTPSSSMQSSPTMSIVSDQPSSTASPTIRYRQFLNEFCFFTGSAVPVSPSELPRTQSASDVETFVTGIFPRRMLSNGATTPTRSSSLDDIVSLKSGSSTPTIPQTPEPIMPSRHVDTTSKLS